MFAIQTWQISQEHWVLYLYTYFLSQILKMLILPCFPFIQEKNNIISTQFDTSIQYSSKQKYNSENIANNFVVVFGEMTTGVCRIQQSQSYEILDGVMAICGLYDFLAQSLTRVSLKYKQGLTFLSFTSFLLKAVPDTRSLSLTQITPVLEESRKSSTPILSSYSTLTTPTKQHTKIE